MTTNDYTIAGTVSLIFHTGLHGHFKPEELNQHLERWKEEGIEFKTRLERKKRPGDQPDIDKTVYDTGITNFTDIVEVSEVDAKTIKVHFAHSVDSELSEAKKLGQPLKAWRIKGGSSEAGPWPIETENGTVKKKLYKTTLEGSIGRIVMKKLGLDEHKLESASLNLEYFN